ncbi:MAG: trypsin-like peptidase domain-containing protein [Gemmatimonadaceae bacterium]
MRVRRFLTLSTIFVLVPATTHAQAKTQAKASARKQSLSLRGLSADYEALVSKVSPSVVEVMVSGFGVVADEATSNVGVTLGHERGLGSGVVVSADGYIVTNAHVVAGADRVRVRISGDSTDDQVSQFLRGESGRIVDARIVGVDSDLDLALIKVNAAGLRAMPLADYHKIRQGELVFAVGAPEGFSNSVTMGVVSSVARQPDADVASLYIQTDAAINLGNSGALVNTDGQLVGLNTSIVTKSGGREGLGFAIPSAVIESAIPDLRAFGHVRHGLIGINIQANSPELANGLHLSQASVVLVTDVAPHAPAADAGVGVRDIIVSIDGAPTPTIAVFGIIMRAHRAGDSVSVRLLRDTSVVAVKLGVIEQDRQSDRLIDLARPRANRIPQLGIVGVEVTGDMSNMLPQLRVASGVIVAARLEQSTFAENPLVAGDIIHAVNRTPVETRSDPLAAVRAARVGARVVLQIERDGRMSYLTMRLE